jgi:ABC-2 type transport system ATP-binding protein
VLEVRTGRPQESADLIVGLPGVRSAALFGDTVHVVAENAEEAISRVAGALAGHGLPADRVERIPPSLEDVFVSLVEDRDRREQSVPEVRG